MRARPADFVSTFAKTLYYNKNIIIAMTDECNFACKHCQQGQGYDCVISKGIMSYEMIDLILDNIYDKDFFICICGGEALLYPEIVEYIITRSHQIGTPIILGTNGFWYNNKEIIDMIKRVKPTFIRLSVDKYHQDYVSLDNLQELIDNLEDSEVKIFGGSIYNHECHPGDEEKFDSLKLLQEVTPCVYKGNGEDFLYENREILKSNQYVFCRASGIVIIPNGDIYMECEMETHGCYLGNIREVKFIDLIPKLKCGRPYYYINPGERINNIYEICKRDKHHLLDDKWQGSKISFNVMGNSVYEKALQSNIYKYTLKEIRDYYDPFYEEH